MTREEKKLIGYVATSAITNVSGGLVAVDIFKKLTADLPLKKGLFRSIGMTAIKYGVFKAGSRFTEKATDSFFISLFGIDKMDSHKVIDGLTEKAKTKVHEMCSAKKDEEEVEPDDTSEGTDEKVTEDEENEEE